MSTGETIDFEMKITQIRFFRGSSIQQRWWHNRKMYGTSITDLLWSQLGDIFLFHVFLYQDDTTCQNSDETINLLKDKCPETLISLEARDPRRTQLFFMKLMPLLRSDLKIEWCVIQNIIANAGTFQWTMKFWFNCTFFILLTLKNIPFTLGYPLLSIFKIPFPLILI